VPIPYKGSDPAAITEKALEIYAALKKKELSVVLDDREEYTPGWKFNQWELKGVPVRVEIGPRDLSKQQVTLARRDTFAKVAVKEEEAVDKVEKLLEEIQHNLYAKARICLEEKTSVVMNYEEFKKVLAEKGGFIKSSWCSSPKCEEKIKEETGATIRLRPFKKEEPAADCVYCGEKAVETVYFARSY
jgi:prolyl-tRNA synthetase